MDNRAESQQNFSSAEQEIMVAYRSSVGALMSGDAELRNRLKPFDENIKKSFIDYIKALSPHLPEYVLWGETHDGTQTITILQTKIKRHTSGYKTYFLPGSAQIYYIHNPSPDNLTPESPNFIGFDNVDKMELDQTGFTWIRPGEWLNDSNRLLGHLKDLITPEANEDPKAIQTKEEFELAKKKYEEAKEENKTELGKTVKQRLTNLRNDLAFYLGEKNLPEKITTDIPYVNGNYLSYLPREDRVVVVPPKKPLLRRMQPKFSAAQQAPISAYMDFTPTDELMKKCGLNKLEHQSWYYIK